ncbi:L-galactonate dehydratase [Colletotrichum salicis]|uniref:L-galactonate dehydratase n=1 Tax=Colletotrichum salicis TaxID=1209931 RepID=A0A135V828_9PEZI|nr:L-galactonate dehydratase [Colletotrichum salicis]
MNLNPPSSFTGGNVPIHANLRPQIHSVNHLQLARSPIPTSLDASGSDAMNPAGDYSVAHIRLKTNTDVVGHGIAFTIGRGNDLCTAAARMMGERLIGKSLGELTENMGKTWRYLVEDSQMRWVGPEKGVVHLRLSACVNAL